MRASVASLALIRRERQGRSEWLAQWNARWGKYSLVGGHKHHDESFRECIVREIREELSLRDGTHCTVAAEPRACLEYEAWSESAQANTAYQIALFDVELADNARQQVDANPQNHWLTEEEIRRQQCVDGRAVSQTVLDLLTQVNWGEEVRS